MPIYDIQLHNRELGRIRIGQQVPLKGKSGTRPERLETFRFTSQSKALIEEIAALYGGTPQPWKARDHDADAWEVVTEANSLDVAIEPDRWLTEWYELWTAAGCQRRCDGQTALIATSKGEMVENSCQCPPDHQERSQLAKAGKACAIVSRISVRLQTLKTTGLWRLDTHSFNALAENASTREFILRFVGAGAIVPATLKVEKRTDRTPGQPVKDYVVPILDISFRATLGEVMDEVASLPASGVTAALMRPPQATPAPQLPAPATTTNRRGEQTVAASAPRALPPKRMPKGDNPVWPEAPTQIDNKVLTAFVIACREAGLTDDERHELVKAATSGRITSSARLLDIELPQAYELLVKRVKDDTVNAMKELGVADGKAAAATLNEWLPEAPKKTSVWGIREWLQARARARRDLDPGKPPEDDGQDEEAATEAAATPADTGAAQGQMNTGAATAHKSH